MVNGASSEETPMVVDVSMKKLEDLTSEEMTSKDYYFDSYAHFGIHEVNRARQMFPGRLIF
jgi:hypothetical protein